MNILLLGMPGSGKGTLAEYLCQNYQISHLSTGNLFRDEIKDNSEFSDVLKDCLNNGKLVNDNLTTEILKKNLQSDKFKNGVLFDGYPRTLNQANSLKEIMNELNIELDHIIYLEITDAEIKNRIVGRRICPVCQRTYNIFTMKPKVDNRCDDDGATLTTRADDAPEKVESRIIESKEKTMPLVNFYSSLENFKTIKVTNLTPKEINNELENLIK